MVTVTGCSHLASALKSNPSYLKELDLRYNHPGESGEKMLSELKEDPHCALEILRVDHGEKNWMKPGMKKYAVRLTLDLNTAHRRLSLSEGNRKEAVEDIWGSKSSKMFRFLEGSKLDSRLLVLPIELSDGTVERGNRPDGGVTVG
ncbi:hypothetical protein MHYP_G00018780 [Metynnis hypsauchen]